MNRVDKLRQLLRRLRFYLRRQQFDRELEEEMKFHLEMQMGEIPSEDGSSEEMRYEAQRRFGNRTLIQEASREMWSWRILETLAQDIRYGARMMWKHKGFTAIAVVTLAIGVGANSSIFSVVNAALLRKLPYDASRLAAVESINPQSNSKMGMTSPADFWDWKEQSRSFEQLAGYSGRGVNLKEEERVESVPGAFVSINFFDVFQARPALGRAFLQEDEETGAAQSIVLSHRFWQRRFGGDPGVVGRTLKTTEGSVTVIGVMPPGFVYPKYAQVWTPMERRNGEMQRRGARYYNVVGRMKSGETAGSVEAEMKTVAARLAEQHPKENQSWSVRVTPWRDYLVKDAKTSVLILAGAVGLVLLIACVNIANLLMARTTSRGRELAIRLALGATRMRLLRQLLVESVLLAMVGGLFGLMIAYLGVEALTGLLPEAKASFESLNEMRDEIRIDRGVLFFTLAITLFSGLFFGLFPGWQATRPDRQDQIKEGFQKSGPARGRLSNALVILEIALALTLLAGAGLLANSFLRMQRVDLGYNPGRLMTMGIPTPGGDKARYLAQVQERIEAIPGVESAAVMSALTLGGLNFPFNVEGRPLKNGDETVAYSAVSPSYFRTLGLSVKAGRVFHDRDTPETPPAAIINETLARQYFPGEDPIGEKIILNYLGQRLTKEIVGVVSDAKQREPSQATLPEILVPFAQLPWFGGVALVRSATEDPLALKSAIQQAIWSINRTAPESTPETFEQILSTQVAEPRLYALLLTIFAAAALLLAAVGIYGVMAYAVTQRTREIGVRMALGAKRSAVLTLVLGQGMKLVALGLALGLVASFSLTRLMKGLLFGVSATDAGTFTGISVLLALSALIACYLPARRATKIDPMTALRSE